MAHWRGINKGNLILLNIHRKQHNQLKNGPHIVCLWKTGTVEQRNGEENNQDGSVPDRDIGVNSFKFPEGDNGADAVVPAGVKETDMEGQVNAYVCIVGTAHVKGVAGIKQDVTPKGCTD